jgi:FkbH-like protein
METFLLVPDGARVNTFSMSDSNKQASPRRVLLAGDTTLDPLGRLLERSSDGLDLKTSAAPYGQVFQILLDANHPAWEFQPDFLVVWTAPQLTLPSFAKLLRYEFESPSAAFDAALAEAEQFAEAVVKAAKRVGMVLVPTWASPVHERWIQTLTWRNGTGPANLLAKANLMLAEKFAAQPNIVLLDAGYWQASLSRPAYDPRMYAVAKILYSQPLFEKAAAEMKAVLRGSLGQAKKVIVCDLDNTLWGGVVGDDGPQNLKLGAPDPVGECFHAFQKTLKGLRSRGILLAISSKNEEKFALSVIEEHPAMVLRKDDFVAWRINWDDKAKNLISLAEELNLGLDFFVFLDDSPQERDQVRQLLPQVLTPDLPVSPSELAPFLSALNCFETPSLGAEDLARTNMYQAERSRKEALEVSGDVDSWLQSLHTEVRVAPLRQESLARAAQLLNKTNQFNLSLRRLDEKTFWNWATEPGNAAYTFHVSDRFGDFGLTGLASFSLAGREAKIVDFVMSCRVMGKKVEEALLGYTLNRAKTAGAERVVAPPVDGPRNGPAKTFFSAKFADTESAAIDLSRVGVPPQINLREEV